MAQSLLSLRLCVSYFTLISISIFLDKSFGSNITYFDPETGTSRTVPQFGERISCLRPRQLNLKAIKTSQVLIAKHVLVPKFESNDYDYRNQPSEWNSHQNHQPYGHHNNRPNKMNLDPLLSVHSNWKFISTNNSDHHNTEQLIKLSANEIKVSKGKPKTNDNDDPRNDDSLNDNNSKDGANEDTIPTFKDVLNTYVVPIVIIVTFFGLSLTSLIIFAILRRRSSDTNQLYFYQA